MDTSLARRQRRRRNGNGQRQRGPGVASQVAITIPLVLLAGFVLLGLLGLATVVGAYGHYSEGLPDPKALLSQVDFEQQTIVYDASGKVELARFGQQKRTVVQFEDLPPMLVDATTSVEDKTFWQNAGFDPMGIVAAAIDTLRGRSRGASTITQQLVRARLLPDEAFKGSTYERKIKEIIQSIRLTQALGSGDEGKRQIMFYYLNQNFYGNQSYGVAAAARSYFGVTDLSKLTIAQAAILAAIPQSPTQFDLVKNAVEQTDKAGKTILVVPPDTSIVQRRNYVLDQMVENRFLTAAGKAGGITDEQILAAKNDPVILAPQATPNWRAPHFVWQVRTELGSILCPQDPENCPKIDTGGYVVRTTLDWNMQKTAEKWVQAAVLAPNAKDTAAYLTKTSKLPDLPWIENLRGKNVHNGALVAIDYRTGRILAYVGSAAYYSSSRTPQFQPQFDVLADGWRQPGSAMKPINYITGIEDRTLTPATMFMDVTTTIGGDYAPTDADTLERGPLRLRQGLQFSLNIPAVKAAVINGPDHVFDVARKFGLRFQSNTNVAGSSIALGTLEVHPIDLVGAYGAIANGGVLVPRTTIASISDPAGVAVWPPEDFSPEGTPVVSPQAAYLITDILAGNTDPAVNPYWGKFEITANGGHRPATLKTGTTNDTKDLSAYGFLAPPKDPAAPALAVGVWMGNSDNSKTKGLFSLDSTAPLWQAFLIDAMKGKPVADFPQPPGIVKATVDAFSGLLPGPFSDKTVDELFIEGTVPTKVDDTKVGIDVDSVSGLLWADGCVGPMETRGFLDLSSVDVGFPNWQEADEGWIERAKKGPGKRGGPNKDTQTATAYFYSKGFQPYGASWGAPFPPTETCTVTATPPPIVDATPPPCPPGGIELNPDGTLVLGPDGQPIPCPTDNPFPPPSDSPAPSDSPPPSESPPPTPSPSPTPPPPSPSST